MTTAASHAKARQGNQKPVVERASADQPCEICTGHPGLEHGAGIRCTGYVNDDGQVAFCTREQYFGKLAPVPTAAGPAAPHKRKGKCQCGLKHGVVPPTPTEDADQEPEGCTLADFAAYAGFTEKQLRENGCDDGRWHKLKSATFAWPRVDGKGVRLHHRVSLHHDPRFKWGDGPPIHELLPRGIETLPLAKRLGYTIIVEGESDQLRLKLSELPVLAAPGKNTWAIWWNQYRQGLTTYVVDEGGDAGAEFVHAVGEEVTFRDRMKILSFKPWSAKDPNDLYKQDPAQFLTGMEEAMAAAQTYEQWTSTKRESTQNPWDRLGEIRAMDKKLRHAHWQAWLETVAPYDRAERESLLKEGRAVFGVEKDTAEAALGKITGGGGGCETQFAMTVATDTLLAEMVFDPKADPPFAYMVYDYEKSDAMPERVATLKVGTVTYAPPQEELIAKGTVLLPSGIEEYETDAALEKEIAAYIEELVQLEDPAVARLCAAYDKYTWIADKLPIAPLLKILGDFGAGKTALLTANRMVVRRGIAAASNSNESPIFRVVDLTHGTVVLDEADYSTRESRGDELYRLMREGHTKGSHVLRSERSSESGPFGVKSYDPFGPKIVASRRPFPDEALESRCIPTIMRPIAKLADSTPLFVTPGMQQKAAKLRNKLLLWRLRRWPHVTANPYERIEGVDPRMTVCALMILAAVDPDDTERREAIIKLVKRRSATMKNRRQQSLEGLTMLAVAQVWSARQERSDRVKLATITRLINTWEIENSGRDLDDNKVRLSSSWHVGNALEALGLNTTVRGGVAWLYTTDDKVRAIRERYGLLRTPVES
jgi:hypothetical protein